MAQLGCGMDQLGCGMDKLGCGMAQLVVCRATERRSRVRISARHPSRGPLHELAAMKTLERNFSECYEGMCMNEFL
jgi:hypothetical protein